MKINEIILSYLFSRFSWLFYVNQQLNLIFYFSWDFLSYSMWINKLIFVAIASTTLFGTRASYASYNMLPRRNQRVTLLEEVYNHDQIVVLEEWQQIKNNSSYSQYNLKIWIWIRILIQSMLRRALRQRKKTFGQGGFDNLDGNQHC